MSSTMTIRMYNVGFGDSFLLLLPDNKTILVDAGFHSQGKGAFAANDLAKQIAADAEAHSGEARIDVVIATHRHQDHVFAFNSAEWKNVEIGEVWMPWVEDRDNPDATKLWKKQKGFAMALADAAPSFMLSPEDRTELDFLLWNAGIDITGLVPDAELAAWSNQGALDVLHDGFKHRDRPDPRFLPESDDFPETFESDVIAGMKVHVLGPPRDPDEIEELDPASDDETYKALMLQVASLRGQEVPAPFPVQWRVPDDHPSPTLAANDLERLRGLAHSADALLAAKAVDDMINSTSLVLVLQIGSARLLLPGDAEWGTWKRILANNKARSLLRGATFFKVGHHGSHNATSKTLVEKVLPREIPAMVSTQEGPGKYRNNIPLEDLLTALAEHDISYARSDKGGEALPDGFEIGAEAKWIDLQITC
ncbi:beta-lactamase domain protein [Mycolicibacterium rhodesiae JS60]|nr:beta-lactamase domain protein [Mycolicibacterium rhodesiae JS60]